MIDFLGRIRIGLLPGKPQVPRYAILETSVPFEIQSVPELDSDVFVISIDEFPALELPQWVDGTLATATVNGRPITAVAPHPDLDDLVFVTTGPPDSLSFLPDPYVEIE